MAAFKEFLLKQTHRLPRMPVPSLNQTIERYLKSAKPFLSDNEYQVTEDIAKEFSSAGGCGEKLQKLLEERAAKTDNWMADWWLDLAYLNVRSPLPVFSSTGMVFQQQQFDITDTGGQIASSAAIVAGLLDFKKILETNNFPPERLGPMELDMSQFTRIFSTSRLPGEKKDTLLLPDPSAIPKYIVVIHNNHFFSVPVYGDDGNVLNQSQLAAQMTKVVENSKTRSSTPVGILTSESRDKWYEAYQALRKDAQNCVSLDTIHNSLVIICLDGPPSEREKSSNNYVTASAIKSVLGGDSKSNSANRWYDHCAQFIFDLNGDITLSCEHSPGEVHPVITDHMEMYWKKNGGKNDPVPPCSSFGSPQELCFNVPANLQIMIETAFKNMDKLAETVELNHFTFTSYGKDFIKSVRFGSPDSYIQMAIQLTFYKLHSIPGAQYETATTRCFLYGRTETIRSCSVESMNFVHAMLDSNLSDVEKSKALKLAMETHREYVMNAVQAQGVDRHLLGLRLIAAENGMEIPKLYQDAGYVKSGNMRLSTSQVPSVSGSVGFFCPLVEDGYGCCYNPRPDQILFGTSAFASCCDTSVLKFCETLEQSLNDMKTVLSNAVRQK